MRQHLVAQLVQFKQGQLYECQPDVVVEKNFSFHIEQSREYTSEVTVHSSIWSHYLYVVTDSLGFRLL